MAIYFTSRLTSSHNSELPTHFTRALSSVEKSSWLSNALFFAKLYVLDLVDPFTRIYEKGSVGRFFHRQVEQLSDFERVKSTLGTIATTVAEHPLDTLTIAQPFLAPQLGSELSFYIQNAISAVTLYQSANLSAHDLKKLAQSGLVGKLVIVIALSSLPGASGATTCHYPSMVDACAGYNSHECATLTMGRIQETVQRCREGDCKNLSLEYTYAHHSNFEGFTPVSATGTCPAEEMCYLVAPAPDLPSIEVCWNPSKILEPRTFDQHDTLSPTFENFHVIGVGHSIYMTKIDGCVLPSPSTETIAKRDHEICHLVPYTENPPGTLILCTSSTEPREHAVTFIPDKNGKGESDSSKNEFFM